MKVVFRCYFSSFRRKRCLVSKKKTKTKSIGWKFFGHLSSDSLSFHHQYAHRFWYCIFLKSKFFNKKILEQHIILLLYQFIGLLVETVMLYSGHQREVFISSNDDGCCAFVVVQAEKQITFLREQIAFKANLHGMDEHLKILVENYFWKETNESCYQVNVCMVDGMFEAGSSQDQRVGL